MENTEIAFINRSGNVDLNIYVKALKEKGIKSETTGGYYGNGILVDKNDKQNAIEALDEINFDENKYLSWLDKEDAIHPVGYIPVMYNVLPDSIQGSELWTYYRELDYEGEYNKRLIDKVPESFKKYLRRLEVVCDRDIYIEYNRTKNAFAFFVKAPFKDHQKMLKICKMFNESVGIEPFEKIYYTDKYFELIKNKTNKQKKLERTKNVSE